jgi:hypothetical protein
MANIAIHGRWCGAKTFPTVCRYCLSSVFYFECDCGCKVFFDDLGSPWPLHRCPEYLDASADPVGIEREYASTVATNYQRQIERPEAHAIVRCDPNNKAPVEDLGIIREVIPEIDIAAKCGIIRSDSVGMGFLGKLATGMYGQITIHAGDLSTEDTKSYTFYIESRLIQKLGLARRQLVFVRLAVMTLPTKQGDIRFAWVCNDIYHP